MSKLPPLQFPTVQRMRPAMGTLCVIEACGDTDATQRGLAAAFAAIEHVDQCMHPTRVGSDLARLNNSVGTAIEIDAATWAVLATAKTLHALSDEMFDPCLPSQPGRLLDLELSPHLFATSHAPMAIDLGGIAKGYAIDQAVLALQAAGCCSGMVNAGGDLRVFGDELRQMLIRTRQSQFTNLSLCNVALAVSEMDSPTRPAEHQGYYRRNNDAIPSSHCAVVLAKQAIIADALTKCAMLCTDVVLQSMLKKFDATLVHPADSAITHVI